MNSKRLFLLCLILLLIGISLYKGAEIAGTTSKENVLTITPLELFSGSEAKYKPLIPYTHGVKFNYSGDERDIIIEATIWDNGEQVGELGSIIGKLASDNVYLNYDKSELYFAIDRLSLSRIATTQIFQINIATIKENSFGSYKMWYVEDESLPDAKITGYRSIYENLEIQPGEKKNIFALHMNRNKYTATTIDINNVNQFKPYWLIIISVELLE